jgi:hypothetical protein
VPISGYDDSKVHLSLAGSGNPWKYLTKTRKRILRGLHDTPDLTGFATELGMSLGELRSEVQPLIDASLVVQSNGLLRPSFLVTDRDETEMVYTHACEFSDLLVERIELHLDDIRASYNSLELSSDYGFDENSLLFVGGRILDIKLLDVLSRDCRVLPPAPLRPSPERPDAHYYFFMVEGDPSHLGSYGQDDTTMPWPLWYFITFGQNIINGAPNIDRWKMEQRYAELSESGALTSPRAYADALEIPFVNAADSSQWEATSEKYAEELCQCYEFHKASIASLHTGLKSATYAPHSIGEFFCWYAHIAYARAIDTLIERGVIHIPSSRFQAAVWYLDQVRDGLLPGT